MIFLLFVALYYWAIFICPDLCHSRLEPTSIGNLISGMLFSEVFMKNIAKMRHSVCDFDKRRYFLTGSVSYYKKEDFSPKQIKKEKKATTKVVALIGVFCALAYVLTLLGNLIPISVAGFLSYDPKDIIIAIAGFILGPAYTIIISLIVSLLELLTFSQTGIIGCIMNIISTVAFAGVASLVYKRKKSAFSAILGLILGTISVTAIMLLWNYFITPYYMHVPREAVADMLLPVFLPFNLIKAGINSAITILTYKPVVGALRKAHIVAPTQGNTKSKSKIGITIVTLFILATLIFCLLIMGGVI